MYDVYHYPEKFGLEIFGSLDDPEANYSFDMFVVWKDTSTGELFFAQDAGCSCPSPFEDYTSRDDLTPIDDGGDQFFKEIMEFLSWRWTGSYFRSDKDRFDADRTELIAKVYAHLKDLQP